MTGTEIRRIVAECVKTCECVSCAIIRSSLHLIDTSDPDEMKKGAKMLLAYIGDVPRG